MLLLFFNGSGAGIFIWAGPNEYRTAYVEPEFRIVRVV